MANIRREFEDLRRNGILVTAWEFSVKTALPALMFVWIKVLWVDKSRGWFFGSKVLFWISAVLVTILWIVTHRAQQRGQVLPQMELRQILLSFRKLFAEAAER